jgi:TP901 family phage tail tape measure protein
MAKMGGARVFFTVYASAKVDELITDMDAAQATISALYLDAIEGITESISEMFTAWEQFADEMIAIAEPVEEARVHFEKFFEQGSEQATELAQKIIDVGVAFGSTAAASLEAAATMAQLQPVLGGAGPAEAGAEGAMLLGAVGMMSTEDAMSRMMQLQMQTDFMYEGVSQNARDAMTEEERRNIVLGNSVRFVNMLNEAENKTGATIQGIAFSMNQFAAAAKLANMEMSEQIALSASLIEQGEEQGKAGRALKMMIARIASNRSDNNELLREHGVEVVNAQGEMKGLIEIMGELRTSVDSTGRSWEQLTGIEQQQIAIAVGGSHHYVRFLKLMQNYNRTVDIQAMVTDSAGSALDEFGQYVENASYRMGLYRTELEKIHGEIGTKLIPAQNEAIKAEIMWANVQNWILGTKGGQRAALWATMAGQGFRMAESLLKAVFMYKVLRVAQQTYRALAAQEINTTATKAMVEQRAAQGMAVTNEMRKQATLAIRTGISAQQLSTNLGITEYDADRLIIEAKVKRAQVTKFLTQSQSQLATATGMTNQVAGRYVFSTFSMSQADKGATQARMTRTQNYIQGLQLEQFADTKKLNRLHVMDGAIATQINKEMNLRRNKIVMAETELMMDDFMLQSHNEVWAARNRGIMTTQGEVMVQQMANRINQLAAEIAKLHAQAKMGETTVTSLSTKATANDAVVKGIWARMVAGATGILQHMNLELTKNITLSGFMSSTMMIASMGVMFFGSEADSAQASMILMALSMLPLIASMTSLGAVTWKTALGMSIVTLGAAALAGTAALAWASTHPVMTQVDEDLAAIMADMDENEKALDEMQKQMDESNRAISDSSSAMSQQFTEDLGDMRDSMDKFDDKRLEVFFGGRKDRMNQALFNEVKNNGVENLYYAPEVNFTNTFNGLTYDQAADEIATMVMSRLTSEWKMSGQDVQSF